MSEKVFKLKTRRETTYNDISFLYRLGMKKIYGLYVFRDVEFHDHNSRTQEEIIKVICDIIDDYLVELKDNIYNSRLGINHLEFVLETLLDIDYYNIPENPLTKILIELVRKIINRPIIKKEIVPEGREKWLSYIESIKDKKNWCWGREDHEIYWY